MKQIPNVCFIYRIGQHGENMCFLFFFVISKHSYTFAITKKSLFQTYIITAACIRFKSMVPWLLIIKIYSTLNKYKCLL